MGRYRSRSRSFSPRRRSRSPLPLPSRGGYRRYDDDYPRDRRPSFRDRRSPAPSGLLLRNLPLDTRPEELRVPFERFGPVKDVYLPRNYHTGEPRGFGFVKFHYPEDASEAKQRMNHTIIGGREIRIVFAEENRKTPQEMRRSDRGSRYRGREMGKSLSRSPRNRYDSYSRSPTPGRDDSRRYRAKHRYDSPGRSGSLTRSLSPRDHRERPSRKRSSLPGEEYRGQGGGVIEDREYGASMALSPRGNGRSPSR
ncbi:hypothetical protein MLD38_036125 [Melastoma candidum]|uniref:Uncharacterized protein n=1 Tax=Melastoma candidum TaxID=119954 RepID=A0ACB9LIS4_9MYRT|nr:hypothetical protein MLD38_036125 [Melastoma candidum]